MPAITKSIALIAITSFLLLFSRCTKLEREGYMPKPGLALTFDDHYVDEWYQCLDLFDSFNVKATYYISNYDHFTKEQIAKLRVIQNRGHEIAYHTLNHPDLVKFLQRNKMGKLEGEEIKAGLSMMNADGFYPQNFAYPYGSHNEILDNCLLRKFKSLRALNGTKDYAKSFTADCQNSKLYAIGMDLSSGKTDEELLNFVNLAKRNNNCLVLVGHHINKRNTDMQVPYERLKKIIRAAASLQMKFYTVSEISRG